MNDGESGEMLIACSDPLIYRLWLSFRLIIPYLLYIQPPAVIWSSSISIFSDYSWYRLVKYSNVAKVNPTTALSYGDDLLSQRVDLLSSNTFTKYFKGWTRTRSMFILFPFRLTWNYDEMQLFLALLYYMFSLQHILKTNTSLEQLLKRLEAVHFHSYTILYQNTNSINFHYQQPHQWNTTTSSRNCRPMAQDIRVVRMRKWSITGALRSCN